MWGLDCVGVLGLLGVNGFAAGLSTYFLVAAPGLLSDDGVVVVDDDVGVVSIEFGLLPLLLLVFPLLLLLLLLMLLFTELVVDGGVVFCT